MRETRCYDSYFWCSPTWSVGAKFGMVINIAEKVQASKKGENKAERTHAIDVSVPTVAGLPFKSAQGMPR